jgi:hypothetical protein
MRLSRRFMAKIARVDGRSDSSLRSEASR